MEGTCHRYYDNNLHINTTVKSVNVIRGTFELYEKTNVRGQVYSALYPKTLDPKIILAKT